MAISSTSYTVNDISICFLWAFTFFLAPLTCSIVLFLWASSYSNASGICVCMPVSYSTSSFMVTSCASVCTSSTFTCPVGLPGACSVACGPCVGPRCDFFCVLVFFLMELLSPPVPIIFFFCWLAPFLPIYYTGIMLPCVWNCTSGIALGISSTFHSL
jgi:hypothetical protein